LELSDADKIDLFTHSWS